MSKIYTPYNSLFFILLLVLLSTFSTCTAKEIRSTPQTQIKVIDGDSLEIGSERIRLMGIDAPEYIQQCKNKKGKKYPCGITSKEYLQKLVEHNPIVCKVHKKDQYERNLCTCYTQNKDINAEMVSSGHAITYLESPYKREQKEAQQNKRGLWAGRFMQPRLFRRLQEQQKMN